jgi:hypothetical protein
MEVLKSMGYVGYLVGILFAFLNVRLRSRIKILEEQIEQQEHHYKKLERERLEDRERYKEVLTQLMQTLRSQQISSNAKAMVDKAFSNAFAGAEEASDLPEDMKQKPKKK